MGAFLKTPMSRFTRHHFMHHVDDNTNFNLMPGADFLRGKAVKPSVAHQEELRRLGVLY